MDSAALITVDPASLRDVSDEYPPGKPTDKVVDAVSVGNALKKAVPLFESSIDAVLTGIVPPSADASTRAGAAAAGEGAKPETPPFPFTAVCIRTLPNAPDKQSRKWTGSNPPYMTGHAMALLRALGVTNVLLDLPSADREDDGGNLIAHRTFFQTGRKGEHVPLEQLPVLPPTKAAAAGASSPSSAGPKDAVVEDGSKPLSDPVVEERPASDDRASAPVRAGALSRRAGVSQQLITELCYFRSVPDAGASVGDRGAGAAVSRGAGSEAGCLADGAYLLSLQVAPVALDAAPSRPVLFPATIEAGD